MIAICAAPASQSPAARQAVHALVARLAAFVVPDSVPPKDVGAVAMQAFAEAKAKKLCSTTNGPEFLAVIGFCYANEAARWQGGALGALAAARGTGQAISSKASAASSAVGAAVAISAVARVQQNARDRHGSFAGMTDAEAEQQANAKMQQGLESSLPKVLEAMWDVSRVDIETTVNAVVDKVLNDHSAGVNDDIRQLRISRRYPQNTLQHAQPEVPAAHQCGGRGAPPVGSAR